MRSQVLCGVALALTFAVGCGGNGGGNADTGSGGGDGSADAGGGMDASGGNDGAGGSDGTGGRDVVSRDVVHCEGATGTDVSGTVLSPNGQDPIFGALVYAIAGDPPAIEPGVGCDTCDIPAGAIDYGVTGADGRFTLRDVANTGGTVNLVVQKGRFRRTTPLTLSACTPYAATAAETSLPGAHGPGVDFPRILVATRVNDDIGSVLTRIGITEFDQVDGCRSAASTDAISSCLLGQMLANPASLAPYNILFIPCGALGDYQTWQLLPPAIVSNLQYFLQSGGRIYASDLSYGVVQRTMPDAFNFPGGTTPTAAGNDPADIGIGGSGGNPVSGLITSSDLSAWMGNLGALDANGNVHLEGFLNPWSAIDTAASTSTVWVHGAVRWEGVTGAVDHPLTVEAQYNQGGGCGRVVMTSYHTTTVTTGPLTPQERVLEWLIFELGGCATPG